MMVVSFFINPAPEAKGATSGDDYLTRFRPLGMQRNLCFVADVRLGERIGLAPDHAYRLRDIRAACRQIAGLWESITPKPALFKKS
jgi:hypothetical protein